MDMDINPVDEPELFSDENRQHVLYILLPALMAIASAAVYLRLYTRAVILGIVGFDDWLCLAALTMIYAFGAIALNLVTKGLGRHIGTLPKSEFSEYLKTFYVMIIFYNLSIASFKLCFLAQYYRIMNSKTMRTLIYAATAFVVIWTLSQIGLAVFQCDPISGFWEPGPDTKCLPIVPGWYIAAAGNIMADILILLIPLPVIKGLNLPRGQKLALGAIFCLGFLHNGEPGQTPSLPLSSPPPPHIAPRPLTPRTYQIWSMTEACTGIICVALPTLRPLAIRWFPRVFLSLSRTIGSNSNRAGGGSRPWQPKDLESTGDDCGLRSAARTARRSRKTWTNIDSGEGDGGGDQDDTLVARADPGRSENRDNRTAEGQAEQTHTQYSNGDIDDDEDPAPRPARKRGRYNTFLDSGSDASVEIELRDVGRTKDRNDARVSYPAAIYGARDQRAREMGLPTGNAVEISSGGGGDAGSSNRGRRKSSLIRVQQDVVVRGLAM
ncbi:hypothetical protein PG993_014096 [Apiospora rasikravindrae]|uniref:Rhodopsin domain-containing protein n=1 Tax=Apiospora rasikravindrae TaxID=990691 RepID=A0ABR1RS28_9PEZI